MFCIDAEPRCEEGRTDCLPKYKPSVEVDDSDSSDCEVPKFSIPAFQKFASEKPHASAQIKSLRNKSIPVAENIGTGETPDSAQVESFHNKSIKLSSSLNAGEFYNKSNYINMSADKTKTSSQNQLEPPKDVKKTLDKILEKSVVCQPGFEKLEKVPTFLSKRQKTKLGLKERDKTKGFNWFGMAAPEMTEEKKNDLLVVQMRKALDPKHFYKSSATKTMPKYFQVGTFVENPVDFYSSRVPKKQRKQTLVDELLADAEFRQYQKKKFSEIQRAQPPKFVHRKKLTHSKRVEAREAHKPKKGKKV